MKTRKFILTILSWTLFTACINSPFATKPQLLYSNNSDTTYYTSTQKLQSNKIPDSVFLMTKLRHLSVQGMDCDYGDNSHCWGITVIPYQIENLKDLSTLRLTVNAISIIPLGLTQLKNLTLVDFSDNNGFSNIDNITKIESLENLYLFGCGLTKLPENIGDLKNLKELGLVGNNFDKAEMARIKKALPNCSIKF